MGNIRGQSHSTVKFYALGMRIASIYASIPENDAYLYNVMLND